MDYLVNQVAVLTSNPSNLAKLWANHPLSDSDLQKISDLVALEMFNRSYQQVQRLTAGKRAYIVRKITTKDESNLWVTRFTASDRPSQEDEPINSVVTMIYQRIDNSIYIGEDQIVRALSEKFGCNCCYPFIRKTMDYLVSRVEASCSKPDILVKIWEKNPLSNDNLDELFNFVILEKFHKKCHQVEEVKSGKWFLIFYRDDDDEGKPAGDLHLVAFPGYMSRRIPAKDLTVSIYQMNDSLNPHRDLDYNLILIAMSAKLKLKPGNWNSEGFDQEGNLF